MATDDRANPTVSAVVQMADAGAREAAGAPTLHDNQATAQTKAFLTKAGFEVHAPFQTSFSIGAAKSLFEEFFGQVGLGYLATDASFYLWVAVPEAFSGDDEAYALRLLEEGIVVAPGRSFGAGGEGHVRVALVPGVQECRRAIERWEAMIRRAPSA